MFDRISYVPRQDAILMSSGMFLHVVWIIVLIMETVSTSEASVNCNEAIRRNIPEDNHICNQKSRNSPHNLYTVLRGARSQKKQTLASCHLLSPLVPSFVLVATSSWGGILLTRLILGFKCHIASDAAWAPHKTTKWMDTSNSVTWINSLSSVWYPFESRSDRESYFGCLIFLIRRGERWGRYVEIGHGHFSPTFHGL